jgi:hypothetical protein
MNGAHDLGGMMGFGPIAAPISEPVFHAEWEKRIFAISFAYGAIGDWTWDEYRAACEVMHPAEYLKTKYYEKWLLGLELLLKAHPLPEGVKPGPVVNAWATAKSNGNYDRAVSNPPAFKLGQAIRVKKLNPQTHTRAPRYLRGHHGEVARIHGAHVFPDSNALGLGENPEWLYSIRFTAQELWSHSNQDITHADLWEPYLEPA